LKKEVILEFVDRRINQTVNQDSRFSRIWGSDESGEAWRDYIREKSHEDIRETELNAQLQRLRAKIRRR
jgi:hypothetical protein